MNRDVMMRRALAHSEPWDVVIIGGGATGVGIALDAATRGYETLLLERHDFGKGTSSRGTKLIHGGVRYLQQGNLSLVREALLERGRLRRNAPHLVHPLPFVVPCLHWWERPYYGLGMSLYDLLAGKHRLGRSRGLSRSETLKLLPAARGENLVGGVFYLDGQFDDARLLIHLAATAVEHGATVLNYVNVEGLTRNAAGAVTGVEAVDAETGTRFLAQARIVVNAAGPFGDAVRRLGNVNAAPLLAPSQGVHLVFHRSFFPGETAMLIPRTTDGRVLFVIPWHGHVLVGTTDQAVDDVPMEPRPTSAEVDFLLAGVSQYLRSPPGRSDVLSAFAGIRPLVRTGGGRSTGALARDHVIRVEAPGLLTIAGGKWTTYRQMAEDGVDQAASLAGLPTRRCVTHDLHLHGHSQEARETGHLAVHGTNAHAIRALMRETPGLAAQLHPELSYTEAEVVWAARHEMARSVEDVLARRTRSLFLNARAAQAMAPRVASLMAGELGHGSEWESDQVGRFLQLSASYCLSS